MNHTIQVAWEVATKGMRLFFRNGAYPSSLERCCVLLMLGQGFAIGFLTAIKQHSIKVNNHHTKFRGSVQLEADQEANASPY